MPYHAQAQMYLRRVPINVQKLIQCETDKIKDLECHMHIK